ncbi:hypothetical protein [Porphyromonas phage phage010a_HG1691old]
MELKDFIKETILQIIAGVKMRKKKSYNLALM